MNLLHRIPKSLRIWFLAHTAVDFIFGLPLLVYPVVIFDIFNIPLVESFTPRLVGAALIAIGAISFRMHNGKAIQFKTMLELKLIWSLSAIIGLLIAITQGSPASIWAIIITFTGFFSAWLYYYIKIFYR